MTNKINTKDVYPANNSVVEAQKKCHPDDLNAADTSPEAPLQDMLDLTARCLMLAESETITKALAEQRSDAQTKTQFTLARQSAGDGPDTVHLTAWSSSVEC